MSNRTYALVARFGDDGGRYLTSQWPQMKARAWALHRAGEMVQVWRAFQSGELMAYDSAATQRLTDHIVKTRKYLESITGVQS
jgi:hypothetical protein